MDTASVYSSIWRILKHLWLSLNEILRCHLRQYPTVLSQSACYSEALQLSTENGFYLSFVCEFDITLLAEVRLDNKKISISVRKENVIENFICNRQFHVSKSVMASSAWPITQDNFVGIFCRLLLMCVERITLQLILLPFLMQTTVSSVPIHFSNHPTKRLLHCSSHIISVIISIIVTLSDNIIVRLRQVSSALLG
jgi:hypothetical protein